jgi:CHAD domain-containing protein
MTTLVPPQPDVSTALLRERILALFRQLPQGLAGDEEAIHQMRVAGRRLRVALPLLGRRPAGRRVTRALRVLRQLTRTAGTSRDLDVAAGMLGDELRRTAAPTPAALLLERRLLASRRRSRLRMAESLMDLEIARLRRDLRAVVRRRGEDLFTALSRLHQQRDEIGTSLAEGFAALGDRFDPVQLHALRKRARRLRYTAELGVALRGKPSEAPEVLQGIQGQLGEIHDAYVLASWLREQAERAEWRQRPELAEEARRLEDVFLSRALERHQALLGGDPRGTVDRALDAMGRVRTAA